MDKTIGSVAVRNCTTHKYIYNICIRRIVSTPVYFSFVID